MATVKLDLDERTLRNGMCKVRMRIMHNRTNSYINTGVWVEPQCYTGDLYNPISSKAYMWREKREQLQSLVRKFDEVTFDMGRDETINMDDMTANDIRTYVVGERVVCKRKVKIPCKSGSFLDFFDQYGQGRSSVNTQKHYAYVWRLLVDYCHDRHISDLMFTDIDYPRMVDISRWVTLGGRGDCTRYKVESYIRAAYKEGQRMKMVKREDDPFLDYKIKSVQESEEVEAMDVHTLRRLMSLDLTNQQGVEGLTKARDVLVMSFYMCGANLIDLYNMPADDGEEVAFVRHKVQGKTKRATHIYIEPELRALLDKYASKQRLLCFQEDVPNYYTFQRRINERCERLSKLLGADVNMALIRRSWATIAGELEAPDRVIDKSMGHKDATVKDVHYEKYDWSRTQRWNRMVMDYVLNGVVPNSVKCPKIFRNK